MRVQVRLFASLRERTGTSKTESSLNPGATVADLLDELHERFPALRDCGRVAYAVNSEYAKLDHELADGDEVALIPPVSGGMDEKSLPR
jgi:molybdopterin converting factor subunit 1